MKEECARKLPARQAIRLTGLWKRTRDGWIGPKIGSDFLMPGIVLSRCLNILNGELPAEFVPRWDDTLATEKFLIGAYDLE